MPPPKREDFVDIIERVLGGVQVSTGDDPQSDAVKSESSSPSGSQSPTSSEDPIAGARDDEPKDPE
jgi:hypothetical protein